MEKTNRIIQALVAEREHQKLMKANTYISYEAAVAHNVLYKSYDRIIEEISK